MTEPDASPRISPNDLGRHAIMRQRWSEVSFVHWRVTPEEVAPYMPAGCVPDVIDGSSWIGLIAFQMLESAFFSSPSIPWLGDFPEVNVRLYSVDAQGRRGVVFRSLEASRLLPVLFAQAVFGLRYKWASMRISHHDGCTRYTTRRIGRPLAASRIVVHPLSETVTDDDAVAMSLTARWAFHQEHLGHTLYCRNHHEPWPLQRAELIELDDGLLAAAGFPAIAGRAPDSVLYSPGVRTTFALPERIPRS